MAISFLIDVFKKNCQKDAIIWNESTYSYQWIINRISFWQKEIAKNKMPEGTVVLIEADFSPNSTALFLTLLQHNCILVPLTNSPDPKRKEILEVSQAEYSFKIDEDDNFRIKKFDIDAKHELYEPLRSAMQPGLVLFSSGSTGKSKAAVHNMHRILAKYKTPRRDLRTLAFLLFDHIGGIDTFLYSFSNGSCLVTTDRKLPEDICFLIEKYKIEVLPVTPTFINLLILSESYQFYDLSSLKYVTYGTEPMPPSTLDLCAKLFPGVILLQKYGTTEVGTLRSKSKSSNSLWVKVGGEGFQTRVVDGILQIKAKSAMLGYLNAPSPFTEDGWFDTGDQVEVDGEFIKILGRKSEIINVGGEKVYPQEVENIILQMGNVAEVTVYGEKNPILGNIVCSKVRLSKSEDKRSFQVRLKAYCRKKLQNYKIPVKILIEEKSLHTERFKKIR